MHVVETRRMSAYIQVGDAYIECNAYSDRNDAYIETNVHIPSTRTKKSKAISISISLPSALAIGKKDDSRNNTQRPPMKIPLHTQHPRPPLPNPLLLIPPLPRQLQRCLDGLRTCVHGQDHLVPEELGDGLCEGAEEGVVECAGGESKFLGLGYEGGDYCGVAVALEG